MSKNTNLSFLTDYITADITNGRIGINTPSPTVAFDVTGAGKFSSSVSATSYNATTTNIFSVDGSEKMRITSGGLVGIGTSSPVATLSMPASTSNSQISTGSIEVQSYVVNNAWIGDNIYFNGAGFVTRAAGYAKQIYFGAGSLNFNVGPTSYAAGATTTLITALSILNSGAAMFSSTIQCNGGLIQANQTEIFASAGASNRAYAFSVGNVAAGDFTISQGSTATGGTYTTRLIINPSGVVTITNLGSGAVTATSGVLSTTSDMTLKVEDGYINNALEKISLLKPRYFYWKEESGLPTDIRQLGFYAQEVNQALGEEAANTPKNENDKWGIYDRGIIAMLTKGIQELKAEIETLKNK